MFSRRARPTAVTLLRTAATLFALVALVGVPTGTALGADPSADAPAIPRCRTADDPAPMSAYSQWKSTFLDDRYRVPRSYVPPNLVSTADAGTNGGYKVRKLVIGDLGALVKAARRDGVTIRVDAGYRSYRQQRILYEQFADRLPDNDAALRPERKGHSEHQLGTALDITSTRGAHDWLAARAWRFGFVISYPPGEGSATCHAAEPGHVRYVGRERAAAIHNSGLVPREWLWTQVVARPSFSVSLNTTQFTGRGAKEYLAFTFTSTSAKREQGFARFVSPMQDSWNPPYPGHAPVAWSPALQTTQPTAAGYFRVEATTCASASVVGFTPSPTNAFSEQSIEMSFDCQPGQSFVLHWFPIVREFRFDTAKLDSWTFPVATRTAVTDPWTPQEEGLPTVRVTPIYIILPPLPWITPPVMLTEIEPPAPEAGTGWIFIGSGTAIDIKVTTTVEAGNFYRVDTGALVILDQPENLRQARTLQVVSCIDLNGLLVSGVDTPPDVPVVPLDCASVEEAARLANIPENTFKNLDGTFLSSQVSVVFQVNFALNQISDWDGSRVRCRYHGGQFEPGGFLDLWTCSLGALVTWGTPTSRWETVAADLRKPEYCPTGKIEDSIVDKEAGFVTCLQ